MVFRPKTVQDYRESVLADLTGSGIRQLSPGGKARAFVETVIDRLGRLEADQLFRLAQTLLTDASGEFLDALGAIYGVDRIRRQDSQVLVGEQNFRFYVRRGTFGDINNNQAIVVPSGIKIFTAAGPAGVSYITKGVTLPADQNLTYFAADAISPGQAGNAPKGVFTRHNFTGYTDNLFGSLLVTNDFGVIGGRDEETDDNYRYRIHLKLISRDNGNEAAIRFALLQLPGVQDIVLQPKVGAFYCYVFGISPVVSTLLLGQAQEELNRVTAWPFIGLAVAPELIGISLNTTIRFTRSLPEEQKNAIILQAANAAEDYINNLRPGELLVLNEIVDRMRNADPLIQDIGDPNEQLKEVFIWRSRNDGTRYSRFLLGNYTPKVGERIVVESVSDAVRLTAAN